MTIKRKLSKTKPVKKAVSTPKTQAKTKYNDIGQRLCDKCESVLKCQDFEGTRLFCGNGDCKQYGKIVDASR